MLAEVFTTGVSGLSHWKLQNIDTRLAKRLLLPGVLGGIIGASTCSPRWMAACSNPGFQPYLLVMGIVILVKALWGRPENAGSQTRQPVGAGRRVLRCHRRRRMGRW